MTAARNGKSNKLTPSYINKSEGSENKMLYQHLSPDYQEKVLNKWKGVIEAGKPITSEHTKMAMAVVLENTERDLCEKRGGMMNESFTGSGTAFSQNGGFSAGTSSLNTNGAFGAYTAQTSNNQNSYAGDDARMPTIVIPTVRRIFPELLAHECVGVQPMNGPVGFAFALRARYGINGKGGDRDGVEAGYNYIDSAFTGTSGNNSTALSTGSVSAAWQSFAGTGAGPYGTNTYLETGRGAEMGASEWWNIGEDMPMARFTLEKGTVEARTRKIATHFSLEAAEDMAKMQGIDIDSEMVNMMSYEVQAEIDRQLIAEMVLAALDLQQGGTGANAKLTTWSPVSADGRNQLERIGTLYTQILERSNAIAITSRRGAATFGITSPKVCALLERLQDYAFDKAGNNAVNTGSSGVAKVGTLRNGAINLFRDTFAAGDYMLLGYKGATPWDTGVVYCPYIPLQIMRATGPDNFSPRIGLRTRYGILNHIFNSNSFYQMIKFQGLTSIVNADGSRSFTY